jgi:hypothetical protein
MPLLLETGSELLSHHHSNLGATIDQLMNCTSVAIFSHGNDLTHENCPRNALGASDKNAREMVIVVRHGKWVVDGVSGRGHRQVCQGVCEGVEEGQGPDLGSGDVGDGLVSG